MQIFWQRKELKGLVPIFNICANRFYFRPIITGK